MTDTTRPGEGVDSEGRAVIDPTKNVLDLVAAAMERQDDLRGADSGLFKALLDGLQRYIDTKISGFEELSKSRHTNIHREFENVEQRRIEHKNDTKIAVDAAFTAAKEAVREQATASDKAISKSESTVGGQIKAVEGTIDDLKARVGKLETMQQTKNETRVDSRASVVMVVGIIGAVVIILQLAIAVLTRVP